MRSASSIEPMGDAGFTLLELLVTLALMALLSVALYGSIRYGTQIWQAARDTEMAVDGVRHAQQTLSHLIATAYPKMVVEDVMHASVAFSGEPSSLELLAPDDVLPGALDKVTIRRGGFRNSSIVLDRKLELAAKETAPVSEILLNGIEKLTFQYFGSQKGNQKPEWENTWTNKTRPPLLVRILAVSSDSHMTWPELTVAPQIAADVTCTVDAVSGFCQGR